MKSTQIHSTALVETTKIDLGTRIWAFTHVMTNVSIGKNCNIGSHCFIESGVIIGNNVTIKNGNMLWDGVILEDGVFVGPSVTFTNDRYPRSPRLTQAAWRYQAHKWKLPTLIQEGASIGAGAILLAGITIGAFSMVGAGTLVTKDVPAHALVVGNPAHLQNWVCYCGLPLSFQEEVANCSSCGLIFGHHNDGIKLISIPPNMNSTSS